MRTQLNICVLIFSFWVFKDIYYCDAIKVNLQPKGLKKDKEHNF